MTKIAITGSTGFVGSNIAAVLQEFGHEVIGLGRRTPEVAPTWPVIQVNFDDVGSIAGALDGCEAVVHCAIANDFNRLVDDRVFAYDAFVGLTQRVTLAANEVGVQPILISTDWVMTVLNIECPKPTQGTRSTSMACSRCSVNK